ncbi:hypothetical protein ACS0TY_008882 [Phlomoides rotata]
MRYIAELERKVQSLQTEATSLSAQLTLLQEATDLAKEQENLKKTADALHQEEMSGSKGRKWRKNVKAVEKEMLLMEEDVKTLEEMYAQGEKAETACSWLPCQIGTWRQWVCFTTTECLWCMLEIQLLFLLNH